MAPAQDNSDPAAGFQERRTSKRFPLHLPVKYRRIGAQSLSDWTISESVNISSGGLLFTTPEIIRTGQGIEAFIAWPLCLEKRVPLKLVVRGFVVRASDNQSAVCFERHEFKTSHMPSA